MNSVLARLALFAVLSLGGVCACTCVPSSAPPAPAPAGVQSVTPAPELPADAAATASPPGSVEWISELQLNEPYGTTVRIGTKTIVIAQEKAFPTDFGGQNDDGQLLIAAFDLNGKGKWIVPVASDQSLTVGALAVAPDGAIWVHAYATLSSDPDFRPKSVLARIDASGKLVWSRVFPGLIHDHDLAFASSGQAAVAHVEADPRGLYQSDFANEVPPRGTVLVFDAAGKEVGKWQIRAAGISVAFDAVGALYVQVRLDDSSVSVAGETIRGPATLLVQLGRDRKPEKFTRLRLFYGAFTFGKPLTLFGVERGLAPNGQAFAWSDVIKLDFSEREQWRKRVCELPCSYESLSANVHGETLFYGRSTAPEDKPIARTVLPRTESRLGHSYRLVKLDTNGTVRFATTATCVSSADLAPDGRGAIVGTDCDGELVLADRVLPAKKARSYLALVRR